MPTISAAIDMEIDNLLEAESKNTGLSKSALIRQYIKSGTGLSTGKVHRAPEVIEKEKEPEKPKEKEISRDEAKLAFLEFQKEKQEQDEEKKEFELIKILKAELETLKNKYQVLEEKCNFHDKELEIVDMNFKNLKTG